LPEKSTFQSPALTSIPAKAAVIGIMQTAALTAIANLVCFFMNYSLVLQFFIESLSQLFARNSGDGSGFLICKTRTNGATPRKQRFAAKNYLRLSRRRIRFVALCIGLDTSVANTIGRRWRPVPIAAAARSASFLRHKL
jgi:hypothetical protein